MKKILLAAFLLIGSFTCVQAQTKPVVTVTIKTPNALCESCKTRITDYLKRYDGVLDVQVYFRRGETRVKYITDRTDIEQIKTAISNCGYDADDVAANSDAYNRLPKSCKKFEDGGGHPKPKTPPPPAAPAVNQ